MRRLLLSLLAIFWASAWLGCSSQNIVILPAPEAGVVDAGHDAAKAPDPPAGTVTDAGIVGRRIGDFGCETDGDCDSNVCFIAGTATENFCTKKCTASTAKDVCTAPLAGTCSRQLYCDLAQ